MTITTNADNDLKLSPAERARAEREDRDEAILQDRVDAAKRKKREKGFDLVTLRDTPQKMRAEHEGQFDDKLDGSILDRDLVEMSAKDLFAYMRDRKREMPITQRKENPRWWWTGGWEYEMTDAMWEVYLSGKVCLRCRWEHAARFPAFCATCRLPHEAAQRAVHSLYDLRKLGWKPNRAQRRAVRRSDLVIPKLATTAGGL